MAIGANSLKYCYNLYMASKYAKEGGKILRDKHGDFIPADHFENDANSDSMLKAALAENKKQPLDKFLRGLGISEDTIKKVT